MSMCESSCTFFLDISWASAEFLLPLFTRKGAEEPPWKRCRSLSRSWHCEDSTSAGGGGGWAVAAEVSAGPGGCCGQVERLRSAPWRSKAESEAGV